MEIALAEIPLEHTSEEIPVLFWTSLGTIISFALLVSVVKQSKNFGLMFRESPHLNDLIITSY
jgi:hypothetical protein